MIRLDIRGQFHENMYFTDADSKSAKDSQVIDQCLFALFGSVCVKAAHKMLMKLNPDQGVNSLNFVPNKKALAIWQQNATKKVTEQFNV